MTPTDRYYELLFEIQISDSQLSFLEKHKEFFNDFQKEQQKNESFKKELTHIEQELNLADISADKIRVALINVLNSIFENFDSIKRWGIYSPDLNQGMVIQGYLFGEILHNLKYCLKSEGNFYKVSRFYMSEKDWNYLAFEALLKDFRKDLIGKTFNSKMEAIKYYEEIKSSINNFIEGLRKNRLM